MVRWLGRTAVRLDGDNNNDGYDEDYDDNGRDYPCVLEDGSMSSTGAVMARWESHWRSCVGLAFFTASAIALLSQLLALLADVPALEQVDLREALVARAASPPTASSQTTSSTTPCSCRPPGTWRWR